MNDSLFLMFEGSAFRMRAKLGFGDEEEVDKVGGETEDGLSEGLSTGEFLSARNHDVIGVEIIHPLVGAQMPSAFDVAAIGHVFVNAISAEQTTHSTLFEQFPAALGPVALITLASLAPKLRKNPQAPLDGITEDAEAFFVFRSDAERLNGRAAMVGITAWALIEAVGGTAAL